VLKELKHNKDTQKTEMEPGRSSERSSIVLSSPEELYGHRVEKFFGGLKERLDRRYVREDTFRALDSLRDKWRLGDSMRAAFGECPPRDNMVTLVRKELEQTLGNYRFNGGGKRGSRGTLSEGPYALEERGRQEQFRSLLTDACQDEILEHMINPHDYFLLPRKVFWRDASKVILQRIQGSRGGKKR
jgi:hypothetical protein